MRSSIDPYPLHRFDAGQPGPHLLITAGVHGDEYEPIIAARALIAEMPSILEHGTVTIIPVVNRSAFQHASRYGSDGLDLARICPGNPQGSVTEADAAFVSAKINEATCLIDMHTGGALFSIYPLAGYMLHPDAAILEQQRNMAIAFGLPIVWGTEASPNGRTLSVARDAQIPAIYVEYGGGGVLDPDVVAAYKKGCIQVMEILGMTAKETTQYARPDYLLEDDQPGGGFLQGKLPSPAAGIFVPATRPGELVSKGDLVGTVLDPLAGMHTEVRADIAGLVFFLRSAIPAKPGESLGGILPVRPSSTKIQA